jgi:hypothetical protein
MADAPPDPSGLSDAEIEARAVSLREQIRAIKEQLRDEETGLHSRGLSWRKRAVWRRDRLRQALRPLEREMARRQEPQRLARFEQRRAAAIAAAEAAAAKHLRAEGVRFQAAARRALAPEVYQRILEEARADA